MTPGIAETRNLPDDAEPAGLARQEPAGLDASLRGLEEKLRNRRPRD